MGAGPQAWAPHPQNQTGPHLLAPGGSANSYCSHLAGKHPPEGGDDSLRRPYRGHHRGKGPVGGVQGDTWTQGWLSEVIISEQPLRSLGPGNQERILELGREAGLQD